MKMVHPFPLPEGFEATWSIEQWQQAANHYWYEMMGVDRTAANYRPTITGYRAAYDHAIRKREMMIAKVKGAREKEQACLYRRA